MTDDTVTVDITPTPAFTAWLYNAARWHPGWKLVFEKGRGSVVKTHPRAPNIYTVQCAYADAHPEEMHRFAMLPKEWADLTDLDKRVIVGI